MIVGDLVTGAAKLADALKNLHMHWDDTKEQWQDAACRRFEEEHLAPLEPQVHLTLDAIQHKTKQPRFRDVILASLRNLKPKAAAIAVTTRLFDACDLFRA